ncbi:MAG: class I SAM-dependent RNA methyltransferase [Proteobacteria bacterium]|nr:class I SAM-dependent RNA methyltransferase [Pseudomonadota bacterium]MBU1738592.1 class I SAM-dependent RNA methyltransferase [Pseudomonadota bacterium]
MSKISKDTPFILKTETPENGLFTYQKNGFFFALVAEGLEEEGGRELAELGAEEVKAVYRGVRFKADMPTVYRINYQSRLCTRILAPLLTFDCHSTKYLYKTARNIPWPAILRKNGSFAVSATVSHSKIRHSKYAALCLKDAVVDSFREEFGVRPDVDRREPDLWLHLHVENNRAVISLDTSGGSLHRRGYRQDSVEAPMQETLAAAIVRFSGWNGEKPLYDPMCGSGTILAEAYMRYCRIPAACFRDRFGFAAMPDFSPSDWKAEKEKADKARRKLPAGLISGSDGSQESVAAARENLATLPGGREVVIKKSIFQKLVNLENRVIISNPPYGIRLGREEENASLMKEFGDFLKHRCQGSEAYLYFGRREMLKTIGLKPAWKKDLSNGGLKGVLARYDMY